MSLDVYVGSLTRYFLQAWETEAQRWVREEGLEDQLQPVHAAPAPQDPSEVQKLVGAWKAGIAQELSGKVPCPIDWDERADAPYFTGRIGWESYGHLLLRAAYDESPESALPEGNVAHWEQDPAYLRSAAHSERYPQLLRGSVWWLPCDFRQMFVADDPGGHERGIGSSAVLLRELEELNRRTYAMDAAALAAARAAGVPRRGAPLEAGARFALALCLELARKSVEHRLVYVLDF